MTTEQTATARVTRRFAHSAERVFDAWLDPESLGQWLFGPKVRDEEIIHLKLSPTVGGTFSFLVRRGEMEIDHVGEYLEIDRPRRLVFTWGVRQVEGTEFSRMVVEIEAVDGGCELRITHEMAPQWAEFVEHARGAWQLMADALARALEREGGRWP